MQPHPQPHLPADEWLALALAPGLHMGQLLAAAERAGGAVESLVGLPEARLRGCGLPPGAARELAAPGPARLREHREWLLRESVTVLCWGTPAYPPQLVPLEDPPVALWVRGAPAALSDPQLAVVGSRRPTPAGRRQAAALAGAVARLGYVITSGLALGIDAAAHEGALAAGGRSIAVCGTGLDQTYPPRHAELARRLAASGAVVSEFPPGTPPWPHHFPRRNRIISGLARGVLVVEAARDSGSLITARLAGEQGRCILAVPGPVHSPLSRGCHRLIKDGARLVEAPADILEELAGASPAPFENQCLAEPPQVVPAPGWLDKPGEMLLDALGFEPASIEDLIARTGQAARDVASLLVQLELEGVVESLPGGLYGRLALPGNRK